MYTSGKWYKGKIKKVQRCNGVWILWNNKSIPRACIFYVNLSTKVLERLWGFNGRKFISYYVKAQEFLVFQYYDHSSHSINFFYLIQPSNLKSSLYDFKFSWVSFNHFYRSLWPHITIFNRIHTPSPSRHVDRKSFSLVTINHRLRF